MVSAWFKKKKPAEHALREIVDGLKTAWGGALRSAIVFGSFASGERTDEASQVNLLVIADALTADSLARGRPAIEAWVAQGHPAPILMRADELADMARTLPIEFLDIADYHRVVYGSDLIATLAIDDSHLRLQVQHDLSTALLRLRRAAASAAFADVIAASLPSVWTLCRALLRLSGAREPLRKADAARRLATLAGYDAALVDRLENVRHGRKDADLSAAFAAYLELTEKLLHYARR